MIVLFSSPTGGAELNNSSQVISIDADYAERNEKTGLTEYRGNVVIRQGTIIIEADRIIIYSDKNKVIRVACFGTPAGYQQRSEDEQEILIARANNIDYLIADDLLKLKTDASLIKNGTSIKGDSISYDLAKGTWKAKGDQQGAQKRIQLVIPPFNIENTESNLSEQTAEQGNRWVPMAVLEARNLAKAYARKPVVKDVSLTVKQGEIVGLLGPNGAGKTTCFYMIVGLVSEDGGSIYIDNEDITTLPIHGRARKGLGYLPQEPSIFRTLSVADNILAILETRKSLSRQERNDRLQSLLDEFNISHLAKSIGMTLSGGERRRVEIARALAANPRFILLDEPFAGVDPISVKDIKKIVRQLRDKGIGVLITDHNVRETLDICEHAYIIGEGHVIAEGATEQILNNEKVRKTYLGDDFTL